MAKIAAVTARKKIDLENDKRTPLEMLSDKVTPLHRFIVALLLFLSHTAFQRFVLY